MNSKKSLLAVALCALMFCASFAQAASSKIGVMDVQKVITECKAGQKAKVRFEAKMKDAQEEIKAEQGKLAALKAEIDKKRSVWSEEKTQEKVIAYQGQARDLQLKERTLRGELKQMQNKELEPILKSLEKVVENYGKKNGYTVILEQKGSVLYFDDAIVVTDSIRKKLDAAMAK